MGALFELTDWLSPYAHVSQSLTSASGNASDGDLDPETDLQHEAGLKSAFLDGRLSATLAAFQVAKDDVAINDPDARFHDDVPTHSGDFWGVREFAEGSPLDGLGLGAGR